MERLGMGFNVRGNVSHSVMSDMKTIAQEPTPKYTTKVFDKEPKDDFFDDYSTSMYSSQKNTDPIIAMMGFESIEPIESRHSNVTSMFSAPSESPNRTNNNNFGNSVSTSRSSSKTDKPSYNTYENMDAQKKFGAAKAISSDQFFGQEASSFERSANLAKFQGSNSISSADYFGDNKSNASNRGTCFSPHFCYNFTPWDRQHSIQEVIVNFCFCPQVPIWRCTTVVQI